MSNSTFAWIILLLFPCFSFISENYTLSQKTLHRVHIYRGHVSYIRANPYCRCRKNSNWFDKFLTSLAGKSFPSTKKVKQLTPANWDRQTNTSTLWFPLMHTSTSFWQGLRLLWNGHTSFLFPVLWILVGGSQFFRLNFYHMYIKHRI